MTITDNNNDNTITSNDNCDKNSNDQINKHNYSYIHTYLIYE